MLFEAITISNKPGIMTLLTQFGNGFGESTTEGVSQIEDFYQNIDAIYTYVDPNDVEDICDRNRGTKCFLAFFFINNKNKKRIILFWKIHISRPTSREQRLWH